MRRSEPRARRLRAGLVALLVGLAVLACADSASNVADNGGIGGTGLTQGQIDAFGSIFSNGVEWGLAFATIEVDGVRGAESDLRVGMQVRVIGDLGAGGTTGIASEVRFDPDLTGPIEAAPTLEPPDGIRKLMSILGRTVVADPGETYYGPGLGFDGLAAGQVLRVSGLETSDGRLLATRLELLGTRPGFDVAELEGLVVNPFTNPDGSGLFDLGPITVRFTGSTVFEGLDRAQLSDGLRVDVRGRLRASDVELDADLVELRAQPLAGVDLEDIELEGFVTDFVSSSDFRVRGVPVDASAATLEPASLVLGDGVLVEVEGRLVAGVVEAARVEDEGGDREAEEVELQAAVSVVDPVQRELTVLGRTVEVGPEAELEDERDERPNFRLEDVEVGDWLVIEGRLDPSGAIAAHSIHRKRPGSDVRLKGPVTALDPGAPPSTPPALEVLGLPVPLGTGTAYFDALGQARTEAQFFRTPGDVDVGDVVRVEDRSALDPAELLEADVVALD